MKKLDIFLIVVLFAFSHHSWGQATLPVTRTAWGSTPTGWTDNGVNRTTVFACSGNDGGSMQASGKYYKVWFSGVPNQLTYKIKGSNPTTGTFKVQESPDGISWTDVVVFSTISGSTCLSQSNTLLSTSRYVQFIYTTKTAGNVDIDDVNITSASLSEIQLQQPAGSDSACGFTYDFGSHSVNSNTDVTVRIENLGTTSLNISSYPITGTNSGEFTVITPPTSPITAGSFSDITIRYTPLVNGTKTAILTINSDDGDESSCTINLLGTATYTSCSELIISEYGEPSSGNGKYIEIYNGTSASINLANYRLWKVNNGGTWPENTLNLSGTLAANTTFLIANNSTDVPSANLYDATFCAWNGNDAVGLAKLIGATWMLVDAVGTDGADPTPGWSVAGVTNATSNHTLVRKSTINIPNTDWASSSGTTSSNSEWIVKTYNLNNTGCNVSSCYTTTSVGFTVATDTITESNSTKTVYITMNSAPLSTVTVNVTDALLGTAAAGTDYSFTPTTLTFTPAESYPNTKSVTITIFDDAISESNENVILDVDALCGALLNNNRYALTIKDNETPKGVIINEFTQGTGSKEYIELVVVGTPATTVDLRGWILDDNSGIFSGGYGTLLGIAPGHVKFSNICSWEKVPVGSIILLYNSSDKNPAITLADDPTDADLDYVYVVGIQSAGSCASAAANLYFSSDCDIPNNSSFDVYTPPVYSNVDWNAMQFRNSGDAIQVRSNTGGFFHGLSYGTKGAGSDCSVCALNQINHPDYPVYGTNALYFSGTNNITYAFLNTVDNDFRKLSNWSTTTSTPSSLETPGSGNNANNIAWINSLRGNFDIVTDDQNYTCQLRQYESRFYLDAIDKIIFYIKNNANVDQGDLTAETYYYNSATAGRGFENDFISGSPTLFMEKTWIGTPTLTSPSTDYKIRFYVNNTELQNYCDYVNYKLDSFYSLAPGTSSYTPATIIPKLYLYRTGGSIRAWTAASSLQVEQVMPSHGSYGSYTYFEYNHFLAFSGYALGNEIVPTGISNTLPVELTNFSGSCVDDHLVLLNWNTASEMNSKEFIVQHSADGIHFTSIKNIPAAGFSNTPKSYAAIDSSITASENYYRLIETDQNGKQNIHPMIFVKCSGVDAFQTYYNHDEGIIIQMNSAEEKEMQFNVYEVSGKLIHHEIKNISKGSSRFTLNLRKNLADGIYIIQTVDGNHVAAAKLFVH